MVDVESMIQSLRLAWLKGIFSINAGTWKTYLTHLLRDSGGLLRCSCNYDIKDLNISSQFYMELLHWWSRFRDDFTIEKDWQVII